MKEETIVRENLMNDPGYTGYCGSNNCTYHMPRTKWDKNKEQFTCPCGWVSAYPADFIKRYKEKWGI